MLKTLLVLASAASSDDVDRFCAERDKVVAMLTDHYGETYLGGGLHSDDSVFEIWLSESDKTWTVLMTMSNGQTCVVAVGTEWDMAPDFQYLRGGLPG